MRHDERDSIPVEVWQSFDERSVFHHETMCMYAADGAMVDFKNNIVVAADGRRWTDVSILPNPEKYQ